MSEEFDFNPPAPPDKTFNGEVYEAKFDYGRLAGQVRRVFNLMQDGKWRTLAEVEAETGDPQASISAQLRHLRKERFGAHTVDKQARGAREDGLWEYRLIVNTGALEPVDLGKPEKRAVTHDDWCGYNQPVG